ncbi:MAG TPA: L,D-transpeptidase family protein [Gemmatimonadaceae bacterium]|nr:L,D-transpeptidase family protein [Gemmatimonadaceae bacterium]
MTPLLLLGALVGALLGASDTTRAPGPVRTPDLRAPRVASALAADSVVVEKAAHRLTLYRDGRPLRTYLVALGRNPRGDKMRRGDGRTPEGIFRIESRNPRSRYYRALRISYPDRAHLERATALGADPGGDIMIHGLPNGQGGVGAAHREFDWTEGCIALTDQEIDEIWAAVADGTPIEIKP